MDKFSIEEIDLGQLYGIKIRHDNSGRSPDWYLDRVEISDGNKKFYFNCLKWLSTTHEDQRIERVIKEKVLKLINSILKLFSSLTKSFFSF